MCKIKNAFGEGRIVPGLGGRLVLDGQEVDVAPGDVFAYTQQIPVIDEETGALVQGGWLPADDEAKAIHDATLEELAEWINGPQEPTEPARGASREAWAEYVVAAGFLSESDLVDDGKALGRDAIRDKYDAVVAARGTGSDNGQEG